MLKRILASIAAIATLATPVAMAQPADKTYISNDAKLIKQETEGAYTEYEYRDSSTNAEIEALTDANGNTIIVKTEYDIAKGKRAASMDEAAASKAAQELLPGCEVNYAFTDVDDGVNEWHAFCTLDGDMWMIKFTADNAELIETEVIPGAADKQSAAAMLTASEAIDALIKSKGTVSVIDIDFDFDDDTGAMYYEGECTLNGKKYEFKINAYDGKIVEWELDD